MKTFLFPFRDFFAPSFLFFSRKQNVTSGNRPFQLFSTLTWTGQGAESIETTEKSALIYKTVEFERDLLKTNEDIAVQSC